MNIIAFLSIGSNLPDGAVHINRALDFLRENYSDVDCSDIYSTPSVTIGDDSVYFNAVAKCTVNDINALNAELKCYESECGRVRGQKSIVIDLDIVITNDEILRPRDFSREYFQIGYTQILTKNS